eukprot:scaffold18449_cov27-Tisochrysis_lutea.AAC.5
MLPMTIDRLQRRLEALRRAAVLILATPIRWEYPTSPAPPAPVPDEWSCCRCGPARLHRQVRDQAVGL